MGEFAALVFAGAMEFAEGIPGVWLVRGVFLPGSVGTGDSGQWCWTHSKVVTKGAQG